MDHTTSRIRNTCRNLFKNVDIETR